jgi:hypothetical protein
VLRDAINPYPGPHKTADDAGVCVGVTSTCKHGPDGYHYIKTRRITVATAQHVEALPAQPQWTIKAEKRGIDPLAMQNTSVSLYQVLLPGMSNVTLRMRYYGFYAWLAYRYSNDISFTNVDRWCRYVRRAEALYALVSADENKERGMAGVDWAGRTLAALGEANQISFSQATDLLPEQPQYLKQKFGALGAAYGSQLLDIGVFSAADEHAIPLATTAVGEPLAKAFEASIGEAAKFFLRSAEAGVVNRQELSELRVMLPSRIPPESSERSCYENLLFKGRGVNDEDSRSRRITLQLILKTALATGKPVTAEKLRWILYATQWKCEGALTGLTKAEADQQFAWAIYQSNDLLHFAYETLLKFVLDVLGSAPSGMPLEALITRAAVDLAKVLEDKDKVPSTWKELLDSTELVSDPSSATADSGERSLQQKAGKIAPAESVDSGPSAASAIRLIAVLDKRLAPLEARIKKELPVLTEKTFNRTVVSEFEFLRQHADLPMPKMLALLLKQRVVERHLWVAINKFRGQGDYTFLLEYDEGRVRMRAKDKPILTNPRLSAAITFMEDIYLLGADGPTASGKALLGTV